MIKKHNLSFVLMAFPLLFVMISANAQPCAGDLVIRNQNDVDNFKTNFPDCEEFLGGLIISPEFPDTSTDIKNLEGLRGVKRFFGNLIIDSNPELEDLSGLDSIWSVGASFTIFNNPSLRNLQGLGALQRVNLDFQIVGNENLETLIGLNSIDTLNQALIIAENNSLENIEGISSLSYIGGSLFVSFNPMLKSIKGLESISKIKNVLRIYYNPELESLEGLDNLEEVTSIDCRGNPLISTVEHLNSLRKLSFMIFQENNTLLNLDGLSNLEEIDFRIDIRDNPNLESITGLKNANLDSLDAIILQNNPKLRMCATENICNFLNKGGNHSIFLNGPECATSHEIEASCMLISTEFTSKNQPLLEIWPNPGIDFLMISSTKSDTGELLVSTLDGKVYHKGLVGKGIQVVDTSTYPQGLYILKVQYGEKMIFGKWIKVGE